MSSQGPLNRWYLEYLVLKVQSCHSTDVPQSTAPGDVMAEQISCSNTRTVLQTTWDSNHGKVCSAAATRVRCQSDTGDK